MGGGGLVREQGFWPFHFCQTEEVKGGGLGGEAAARTRDCAGYVFLRGVRRLSMEWRRIQKLAAKRPEAMTEFTETVIQ